MKKSDSGTYWGISRKVNRVLSLTEKIGLRVYFLYEIEEEKARKICSGSGVEKVMLFTFFE